jgi:catechol 2,3-dioxygenase-like lactoylglutathione lyase family enzyme
MKMIPLLRCSNLKEAVTFYTTVLDFTLKYPAEIDNGWISLINNDAELLLTGTDGTPRIAVYIHVSDIDALYKKYISRGLLIPNNPNSPVHNRPINQTWGVREFYVNDPCGNTLRFAQPLE